VKQRQRHAADINAVSAASLRMQCMLRNGTANTVFAGKSAGSASATSSNARARFWFHLVEMMTGTILMNGS
jgi:hypothetical protein